MFKLADMLQPVKESSGLDSAWCVKFACALHMDVKRATELFVAYGRGYIYTQTGFAMPDSPYMRRKLVANFGACVVVDVTGSTWIRTQEAIGSLSRKASRVKAKREYRQTMREEREYRDSVRRERMFSDSQGVPCPKRGGKANAHSDMGKYVYHPANRFSERVDKTVTRLVVIG